MMQHISTEGQFFCGMWVVVASAVVALLNRDAEHCWVRVNELWAKYCTVYDNIRIIVFVSPPLCITVSCSSVTL